MSDRINLLSRKKRRMLNRESLLYFTQMSARIILAITILSAIVVFILNRSGNLPLLQQQDKTISSNLTFLQQKIIKFLLIRERLGNISPILSKKSSINDILFQISASLPSGVSLDAFTLDKTNITLAVSSSSLSSLNDFLDAMLVKVNQKQLFKKITVTSLSSDNVSGNYSLTLTALYYE